MSDTAPPLRLTLRPAPVLPASASHAGSTGRPDRNAPAADPADRHDRTAIPLAGVTPPAVALAA